MSAAISEAPCSSPWGESRKTRVGIFSWQSWRASMSELLSGRTIKASRGRLAGDFGETGGSLYNQRYARTAEPTTRPDALDGWQHEPVGTAPADGNHADPGGGGDRCVAERGIGSGVYAQGARFRPAAGAVGD